MCAVLMDHYTVMRHKSDETFHIIYIPFTAKEVRNPFIFLPVDKNKKWIIFEI